MVRSGAADWITDPLRDTLLGGQVTWGLSEIPSLIVLMR